MFSGRVTKCLCLCFSSPEIDFVKGKGCIYPKIPGAEVEKTLVPGSDPPGTS